MKRRSFIKSGSLLAVPGFLGGVPVSALASSALSSLINGESDRVLVLIQLNGGNDGLNMVIPIDQIDNLAAVRPNIYIPSESVLNLNDQTGLHPSMTGAADLYNNAKLNIIQSVAYPNQNRSHFRSSDIWHTGSDADQYLATGWLGRYFNNRYPGYPAGYPTEECPHPFALTIGNSVTETCQGETGNYSLAIVDPENLNQLASPTNNDALTGCAKDRLDFLISAIQQTNVYSETLQEIYELGTNMSDQYNLEDQLAARLKTVARLISGGSQTKVYVVSLGGFDTHAFQAEDGDSITGIHADLLQTLSDAIAAFQDDIDQLGLSDRVIGMTYSEFGRRIRSNASLGTDHGTAAPLMIFGKCVNAGIVGQNPEISLDVSQNEGVPMQHDFRSVYGSLLMDWFDVKENEVNELFNHDFQYIPIANTCNTTTNTNDLTEDKFNLKVYPNPFRKDFNLEFESENEWVKISVFNSIGSEVKVLMNKTINNGSHNMNFDLEGVPSGAYFIRVMSKNNQRTIRLIKH